MVTCVVADTHLWRPENIIQIAGSGGEKRPVPAVQHESQGEQQGQALRCEANGMQQPPRSVVLPVVRVGCHGPLRPPLPAALRSLRLL